MKEYQMDKIIRDIMNGYGDRERYGPELVRPKTPQDQHQFGFVYPVVTPQQLEDTNHTLGFSLPDGLQTLFRRIANGGFGPGYGLRGAIGGFPNEEETIVGMYPFSGEHLFELEKEPAWEHWKRDSHYVFKFSSVRWWNMLLPICAEGDGGETCLYAKSGEVFHIGPASTPIYWAMQMLAPSLEDWLESWLCKVGRYEKK